LPGPQQNSQSADIWRAAQLLIKQRDDHELFAAGRVDDMMAHGDVAGNAARG